MPWQWGKISCITLCSGGERQISFIMLHNGVRSWGTGQIYATPASWQPCPQDKISKSTSDSAALILNTEKQIIIPVDSVTLWVLAGLGLFSWAFFSIPGKQCSSPVYGRLNSFSPVVITGSSSFSTLNVSYKFTWLLLPHWSKECLCSNPVN